MLTVVPFSGFYYSLHDSEIDVTIERMFSDRDTGCTRNAGLESALFDSCDFTQVQREYAKAYVSEFASEFSISGLIFESMQSPKYYNFETDRIFAHISESEVKRLFSEVSPEDLAATSRDMFTSRSGFISHYSPEVSTWGDCENWDHNQIFCLLRAVAGPDFDHYREYDLMCDYSGNGYLDQWIENATPNISRLYRIHEYLQLREAR